MRPPSAAAPRDQKTHISRIQLLHIFEIKRSHVLAGEHKRKRAGESRQNSMLLRRVVENFHLLLAEIGARVRRPLRALFTLRFGLVAECNCIESRLLPRERDLALGRES